LLLAGQDQNICGNESRGYWFRFKNPHGRVLRCGEQLVEFQPQPVKPSPPARVWIFRILLVLFVAGLLFRAWQARNAPFEPVRWAFESADDVHAWLLGLIRREVVGFGLAFLLGLLTPLAGGTPADTGKRALRWLVWWIFGAAVIAICLTIAWRQPPPPGALLLPFASYLLGVRLSSSALRGPRRFAWALGQAGALGLLLVAAAALAVSAATSTAPLEFEAGSMSAAAKRQLAQRIRGTRTGPDQPRELQLADAEINALLYSALNRRGARLQARVHFEPSTFSAQSSLALPRRLAAEKFLNVQVSGRLAIADGKLDLGIHDLRAGRLAVPAPVLRLFSSALHALLLDDPQIRRIVEAIDAVDLQPGAIRFVFQPGAVSRQVVPSLTQLLWGQPDVAVETSHQVRQLIAHFDRLPPDADRFGLLMQAAFSLAAERSAEHDPRLENRAALFALAILLGHPDLEPFVGEVLDADLQSKARRMLDTVTVRGRVDWVRHFLVSAALVLVSNEATSDRIGLLKEQLDSQGGSGFSFGDMLANAAGTRFALAAIRDDPTARAVQARLTRGFEVDAIFPPAADLPEDLPAAEFQARFGGIGGPGYRALMEEINRRLAALPPF
jgi:hypothetical protein